VSRNLNLAAFNLSEAELEIVKAGMSDEMGKKPSKVDLAVYGPKVNEMAKSRAAVTATAEKEAGKAFLKKAAAEKGAVVKPSGLVYVELKAGSGPNPKPSDRVKVNYTGTFTDGKVFDSNTQHGGQPAAFPLTGVIPCWTEGLQLMKVGGKARLTCPSSIAYGDEGRPGIKGGATLVFEVELLSIDAK
jgi:FKBP-type peptidyl-prolyl cis-trans isomerase FkpA